MAIIPEIKIPEIDSSKLNNEQYIRQLTNYLRLLDDGLRYAMENIDDENISKQFIKNLIVGHLLIENGNNKIVADPEIGLQLLKGKFKQMYFDMKTGEAEFGGTVKGGKIQSTNYVKDSSGMLIDLSKGTIDSPTLKVMENGMLEMTNGKIQSSNYSPEGGMLIDLSNGTIDTVNFKILDDGSISFTDAKFSGTILGPKIKSVFGTESNNVTMEMSDTSFSTYQTIGGLLQFYGSFSFTSVGFQEPYGYITEYAYDGIDMDHYSDGKIFVVNKYEFAYKGDGQNGALFLVTSSECKYNGSKILTENNYPGIIRTDQIIPSLTSYGNINFNGSENAAAVNWVQANYYDKAAIDQMFADLETKIKEWVTANFAPAGHGHDVSDIAGAVSLQTANSSYAPAGHGHDVSQIAGALSQQTANGLYAPSGHGHDVSQIAGALSQQTANSSYAPMGHGHDVSDVAGAASQYWVSANFAPKA